ncbi:MAG TPA: nuclear transport factor 2 family protein, partial [Gaiellaceae bacterium]|nr:nuclear transport factor 2 family protein [Gaiellaceae bacterium]
IAAIFRNNPTLRFRGRSFRAANDFAVSEWTATVERDGRTLEWDGVDVFPIRDGLIARKDVYSSSHRPREL